MIKRIAGKYVVLSETTGRRFGTYDTKEEAARRLRQIEFFKHLRQAQGRHLKGWKSKGSSKDIRNKQNVKG